MSIGTRSFTYNFWRPVTAIRNGDNDANDATERDCELDAVECHADASGISVAGRPFSPACPSAILESVFGPKPAVPYTVTDFNNPKLKRPFTDIAQMADEHANVRDLGRHPLPELAGSRPTDMGRKIAAYLIENSLKPRW